MENTNDLKSNQRKILFSYFTGLLTGIFILFIFLLFMGYLIGFGKLFNKFKNQLIPSNYYSKVLFLPKNILEELIKLKAPIDNAHNPTQVSKHDTIIVRPDEELGYVLNPDVSISVHMLKTTKAFNLDPPILHLKNDSNLEYSNDLKTYLKEQSRIEYLYSTNSKGFRKTVPNVQSDKKILIIGDSVAFGVGVDDENTAASHLQKMVGEQYEIINTGVGGYSGQQAFLMAKKLSNENDFAGLIYIACQNDFMEAEDWSAEAHDVLGKIDAISNRFNDNIIVVLETFMEYNLRDFFLSEGWSDQKINKTYSLRQSFPQIIEEFGFAYHDWTENVSNFMQEEKSIFSRLALYADHVHLSSLGNELLAKEMYYIIQARWSLKAEKSARKLWKPQK